MIIEIDDDKVLWSHGTNLTMDDSWSRADIEELIKVYENQKHGQWIKRGDNSWECSICHEISCCKGNYCVDCGTKMDGKEKMEE